MLITWQYEAETEAPTTGPTTIPTTGPTAVPTTGPTIEPTSAPTAGPQLSGWGWVGGGSWFARFFGMWG